MWWGGAQVCGVMIIESRRKGDGDLWWRERGRRAWTPDNSIEGPLLPNKRNNLASPTRIVLPSHFVPWLESLQLSVSVANSISEVRALSTRCLKWSVFSDWCAVGNEDTSSCDITSILTFLQELLDKGHTLCLLEVYVTAIAANHTLKAGQSVGKNNLVVKFLRRVRRFNLPKTSLSIF